MVTFSTTVANSRIDMSDPLLVDFNRFDPGGEGGQGPTNYSWFADDNASDPPLSDVDFYGSFFYGSVGQPLNGGSAIEKIGIDRNNNGFDIFITGTGGLGFATLAATRSDPVAFWNLVLSGNDSFNLAGLGLGLNVIFGDDLASAVASGNPTTPTDFGGNDTITGGDNQLDLIGDVHTVEGFSDAFATIFRAFYQAGNDTITAASTSSAVDIFGDAFIVGDRATLNGGNDQLDNSRCTYPVAFTVGDVSRQTGGTVNGGDDTLSTSGGSLSFAAGDVERLEGGTLIGGNDTITLSQAGRVGGDAYLAYDTAVVTGGNDRIIGFVGNANVIAGDIYGRDNTVTVVGGNDVITGGKFDDDLFGEVGSAIELAGVSGGNDRISGDLGNDRIFGQTGNDFLDGGIGNDTIDGGGGIDTLTYASATAAGVTVDLAKTAAQATGLGSDKISNVENLHGTNFADRLGDNNGINRIEGRGGNDTILARAGNDLLFGGNGIDAVDYSLAAGVVTVDLATRKATGSKIGTDTLNSIENATGGKGSDTLRGSAAANLIRGGNGSDVIDGRAGNDKLEGGTGEDRLIGNTGNDTLNGGIGVDTLTGGAGKDKMNGDAGRDIFVFGKKSGADTITGFKDTGGLEDDRIDVRGYNFASNADIVKVASGDNLVLGFGGGNSVTLVKYLANHSMGQINDDLII